LTHPHSKMLALGLAALAVRLVFIFAYGPTAQPVAWGDDPAYDAIATRLVIEHQYVNNWYPPGYPLFLALIYALFDRTLIAVQVIQAVLGAATCVLTYSLGRRFFSERVALLAAVLLAVYPGHVYMSWRILGEGLYMLLLVTSTVLVVPLTRSPRAVPIVALGATMGFANLVKSNLLIYPPLLIAWFAVTVRGRWQGRLRWLLLLSASFGCIAMITPIANFVSSRGNFAPLPGNAGHALWYSNNPIADGYFIMAEQKPEGQAFISRHGFARQLEHADDFEKDRLYRQLALLWIRDNPGQFLVLCLRKLNNAFGLFPHAATFERSSLVPRIHLLSYGLLAPFALAGMIAGLRRWREFLLLYIALASYVLMVLVFYGTPRFTIIVIPYLLIFASYAIVGCLDFVSVRKRIAYRSA
jgi:4-amino-4-deoxy-L-arabinose transferase-like glycosyltransferase